MRCHFEDAIKNKSTALKEDVAPVPAVILNDVVCLHFYPKIERDQCDAAYPSTDTVRIKSQEKVGVLDLMTCITKDNPVGTRKHAKANMQYDRKSLRYQSQNTCNNSER